MTKAKISAHQAEKITLRITNDSMFNPSHHKSIPDGAVLTVDPNQIAKNQYIVVAATQNGHVIVGELCDLQAVTLLRPLNPAYSITQLTEVFEIVGVVTHMSVDLNYHCYD